MYAHNLAHLRAGQRRERHQVSAVRLELEPQAILQWDAAGHARGQLAVGRDRHMGGADESDAVALAQLAGDAEELRDADARVGCRAPAPATAAVKSTSVMIERAES
jgi:hypothetical protein